jgi:hypothetical protein
VAFFFLAAGCGGSEVRMASHVPEAGADGPTDASGDEQSLDVDAGSRCSNLAAAAKVSVENVVAANQQCDADLDCTSLLWPTCVGCGAYAVNRSGAPALTQAIDQACVDFDAAACEAPGEDASCPASFGMTCFMAKCMVVPPSLP